MRQVPGIVCGVTVAVLAGVAASGLDDAGAGRLTRAIDTRQARYVDIARRIWGFAELGYLEEKSSALLQSELKSAGFEVTGGVAGIPTAFVATWGTGRPVIAFIGEYDAVPGLSQDAVPERKPLVEGAPGHGCGHHLLGTASAAAAIAVREWLAATGRGGTVRYYGTPAEEGGSGKPGAEHRAGLRGGLLHGAPRRHPRARRRLGARSEGGGGSRVGTGTRVEHEVISAVYNVLPNEPLARLAVANLERVGGVRYSPEEQAFAERIHATLSAGADPLGAQERVLPLTTVAGTASTDLGDVSWNVPTIEIETAAWVPGTPGHSWQAVASGGTGIGAKGMIVAAKALALTGADLFTDPRHLEAARADFERRRWTTGSSGGRG